MNRRSAIRTLVIVSAGTSLLPSCVGGDKNDTSIVLKKIKITNAQGKLLASLTQTIIPTTNTPGAKEEKSDEFILKMTDDCASPEDQQKFIKGMEQFADLTQKKFGQSFTSLSNEQKKELLTAVEAKKDTPEDVAAFYRMIKGSTLQNYMGSQYYMTSVMNYNIIPKKYKGCIPVNKG